jgi:hypothetical protein
MLVARVGMIKQGASSQKNFSVSLDPSPTIDYIRHVGNHTTSSRRPTMSILYFIAILYAIAGAIFIGSIIFTLLRAAYCYITGWEPEVNMDPLSREDAEFMREYLFHDKNKYGEK